MLEKNVTPINNFESTFTILKTKLLKNDSAVKFRKKSG